MNQLFEAVLIALAAIWANKLRSFLTLLGNIVAVTSIIAVVSLIQGMNATVADAIVTQVGADAFRIERMGLARTEEEEERQRRNPRLTFEEAQAIRRFSPLVRAVMAQASAPGSVSYRDTVIENVSIRGVTAAYLEFSTYAVAQGRPIAAVEIARSRPVALLGWEVADKLFGSQDPVDKIVKIDGVHFRVVGVNEKKGTFFGASFDDFVVIPMGMHQKLYGPRPNYSLLVRPVDPARTRDAMDQAAVALRIHRKLQPREPDNFGMFTSDTVLDLYEQATRGIFALLVSVVALSLVVGGIVIMNIMLMVVTERTPEIGLRKALGARRRDIAWQVLTESVTLSTVGGLVGVALGAIAAWLIARLTPLPASVQLWSVLLGLVITASVGLFFGLYPAMRAARLDPVEALRRE